MLDTLSIGARVRRALNDPATTDEQASAVASLLREQRERVERQCSRNYLFFLGFAAAFSLLMTEAIADVDVLGVALYRRGSTVLLLAVLAAYFLYRAAAAAVFTHLLESATRAIWLVKLQPFAREGVADLLTYPTVYGTEAVLSASAGQGLRRITAPFPALLFATMCIGPVIWFAVATHWVITHVSAPTLRIGTIVPIWTFVARSFTLALQTVQLVYREARDIATASDPETASHFERAESELRNIFACKRID